ncbi:MAG: hypothetical protein D6675_16055 [Gemmatimonadetes bacterium]|nr:MAG: hypothetical protein D6675_16055 [Gemmatimonadota bacterium]
MRKTIALLLVLAFAFSGMSYAAPNAGKGMGSQTYAIDTGGRLNVNNVDMFVTNIGSFAWDIETGDPGLYFPNGTDRTAVFASGIWIGGLVNGEIEVRVAEYSQDYTPGHISNGNFVEDNPAFKIYSITSDSKPGDPDWEEWVNAANTLEVGPPLNEDGTPALIGDQTLWCVYNLMDMSFVTNDASAPARTPLPIEIHQTAFAYNRSGALGNVVFLKLQLYNKGDVTIDDCYISLWSDPDLGGASDDYVGCDVDKSLGYCYNATNTDNIYGSEPPCVGYDFFQGPLVYIAGETYEDVNGNGVFDEGDTPLTEGKAFGEVHPGAKNLGMSSFNKYINGTDPHSAQETYWYMQGLDASNNGAPVVNPITGEVTPYNFEGGDPVTGTGWLDSDPADRRFMQSTGPFTFAPGDRQEIVAAIVLGQGKDRLTSITAMRYNDLFAQSAFDADFDLPSPPTRPNVTVTELDQEILLTWDNISEDQNGDYPFEGYNIYQGETVAGPWKRIATFDLNNSVGIIFDNVFDVETGVVINKPVQFGSDSGLRHRFSITQDYIRGGSLKNYSSYYFAVTAYAYDPDVTPKTLENSPQSVKFGTNLNGDYVPVAVIPHPQRAGNDLDPAIPEDPTGSIEVTYDRVDDNQAPTTDIVEVYVVDPVQTTGHDYKISWEPVETPQPVPTNPAYNYAFTWKVEDLITGQTVLQNQWNKDGDENYEVVDGVMVKVIGAYKPELQTVNYVDVAGDNGRAISWVNWGGAFFGGAIDYGMNFFGSDLDPEVNPEAFGTVQLVWKNDIGPGGEVIGEPAGQKIYRYDRPGYSFSGMADSPVEAWLTVGGERVQQLNLCMVEWVDSGIYDGVFQFDCSSVGGREYLFVMASPYDGDVGGTYNDDNFGLEADVLYAGWLRMRGCSRTIEAGDYLEFVWAKPGNTNDTYLFSTSAPVQDDPAVIKTALDNVKVVPNPYYAHSSYELDTITQGRVVKFTNLPHSCKIRIFNLAGDLVRTLEKSDENSHLDWNLLTERSIPVASGMYIYHVEAYERGTQKVVDSKVGKMAVFIEAEKLNTY